VTEPRTAWRERGSRETERKPAGERWADILEVSARLFAKQGYTATSLQHIADELGILKGSLYYYITTKDDLLYEVIRGAYLVGIARVDEIAASEGTAVERLRRAIEGHILHLIETITATTVFLHEFDRLSDARREELAALDYTGRLVKLVAAAQEEGSLRADISATLATMSALGSANWIYRWYHEGAATPQQIARDFADIFIRGMSVP
jgi:AcrR family transcriptional regulator